MAKLDWEKINKKDVARQEPYYGPTGRGKANLKHAGYKTVNNTLLRTKVIREIKSQSLTLKFHCSVDKLKGFLSQMGAAGSWTQIEANKWHFMDNNGAVLNFWPSNGTIHLQGQADARVKLFTKLNEALKNL